MTDDPSQDNLILRALNDSPLNRHFASEGTLCPLIRALLGTKDAINKMVQATPKGFTTKLHLPEIESVKKSLSSASSNEDLSTLSQTSIGIVKGLIDQHIAKIQQQRSKELRFDVKIPETSTSIIESYIDLSKKADQDLTQSKPTFVYAPLNATAKIVQEIYKMWPQFSGQTPASCAAKLRKAM